MGGRIVTQFDKRNISMMMDLYEMTMANGYFANQQKTQKVVFDVFYRKNPDQGGYAVFAGLEQVVEYAENLHFDSADIDYFRSLNLFSEEFLQYLKEFRFTGDIYAFPEGTVMYPNEPVITVVASLIDAQLIETAILTQVNHQSLIATKTSRIVRAAQGRIVSDFGARRAHNIDAAVYGARAAYIGGASGTATVMAGQKFRIPVNGTMAHSWVMYFKDEYIKNKIFGNIEEELSQYFEVYDEYEIGTESYYCKSFSICEIFEIYGKEIDDIIIKIRSEFEGKDIDEIPKIIQDKRRLEFENYIKANYPKEKIKEILGLFKDRTNDSVIKASVSTEATVPTIYEYIVGIAWYYFSGEKINLLNSFNLTLSADFEPLIHAGGGQGDIVIYEEDKVIMLEATLMNENSQKRGEWEPVLRHSINLKIEEELNGQNRKVTSFFIAENFDYNTINIWKAIASVPLESSIYRDRFTDNVVIMPINNDELASLMDKSDEYDDIVDKVRGLFEIDNPDFDMEWRNKFIRKIL